MQQRQHAHAVLARVSRQINVQQFGARGDEIPEADKLIAGAGRRRDTRPAGDKRQAMTALLFPLILEPETEVEMGRLQAGILPRK